MHNTEAVLKIAGFDGTVAEPYKKVPHPETSGRLSVLSRRSVPKGYPA